VAGFLARRLPLVSGADVRRTLFGVALGTLLLVTLPSGRARADLRGDRCSKAVTGWVDDAARATATRVHAIACTPERVTLRLEPIDVASLDVDVERSTARAFRQAGGFGISPILQVADFQDVAAARREAFERLVVWIAEHPDRVAFDAPTPSPTLDALVKRTEVRSASLWFVGAAALLAFLARIGAAAPARFDRLATIALFAVSLALRLAFGAWGPLRINGLGPLWIMAAAVDAREADAYGPGYAEIFGPLVRHLPLAPDHAVYVANVVISAVLPPLLFVAARVLGIDARRSLVVALFLALDVVSIRIAATESYVPVIGALTAAASVLIGTSALHARRGDARRAAALVIAAGLLLSQSARVHPVAWVPVALAPLAASAVPDLRWPARALLGIVALSISGAIVALTSASQIFHAYASMLGGDTMHGTWRWPRVWLAILLAALALGALFAKPRAPFVLGALSAVALACTRENYGQSALWQASFDRLYLLPLLVAGAALVPEPPGRARGFFFAAAAVMLALFAWKAPILRERTTDHDEYRWARGWLATFPPSCRIAYVAVAGRRNLFLPTYVAPPTLTRDAILRLDGRAPIDARLTFGGVDCLYYAHTSLCSTLEGRPVCDDVERQLVTEPSHRAAFAAAPSNDELPYDRERVESVVSRVMRYRDAP